MKNRDTWREKIDELDEIKEPRNKSRWNQSLTQSGGIFHAWESIERIFSYNNDNDMRCVDETD